MTTPTKMTPGDELHLTLLMTPYSLNFVTGPDRQHLLAYGRAAFDAGKASAPQAALAAMPLPLLVRDIARDLGITVPQACIALKPLGNYSTNSAVTAEMARMLRNHFPDPAPMPVAHPHHCTARTADGSCEECEGHAQAMAEWNAERAALAATPAAPAPSDEAIIAWAMEQQTDAIKALRASGFVRVARAVLARWAAGVPSEPMCLPQHADDIAVEHLASLMKFKLRKQRIKGYGGWDTDCTQQRLSDLLRKHVEKGDPVDVANFCAFLAARGEGIAATPKAEKPVFSHMEARPLGHHLGPMRAVAVDTMGREMPGYQNLPAHPAERVPEPVEVPSDEQAFDYHLSDCESAGIQYHGPSYERGFLTGKIVATDAAGVPAAAPDARDAALWREHVSKLDALVTYCPTCCQGFAAKRGMSRDEVIFECGKASARAAVAAPAGKGD